MVFELAEDDHTHWHTGHRIDEELVLHKDRHDSHHVRGGSRRQQEDHGHLGVEIGSGHGHSNHPDEDQENGGDNRHDEVSIHEQAGRENVHNNHPQEDCSHRVEEEANANGSGQSHVEPHLESSSEN